MERFKRLAEKYGFKIKKVSNTYYDEKGRILKIIRRNDILSVQYQNHHIMTIPKKMYGYQRITHRPMGWDKPHPDYFTCEHQLKNWNLIIKRTPYLKEAYENSGN